MKHQAKAGVILLLAATTSFSACFKTKTEQISENTEEKVGQTQTSMDMIKQGSNPEPIEPIYSSEEEKALVQKMLKLAKNSCEAKKAFDLAPDGSYEKEEALNEWYKFFSDEIGKCSTLSQAANLYFSCGVFGPEKDMGMPMVKMVNLASSFEEWAAIYYVASPGFTVEGRAFDEALKLAISFEQVAELNKLHGLKLEDAESELRKFNTLCVECSVEFMRQKEFLLTGKKQKSS